MNKQYISNDLADKTLHLKLMNMRKSIILLAFILGGFTVANAQSVVEGTKLTDNWSVGVNAGGVTPLSSVWDSKEWDISIPHPVKRLSMLRMSAYWVKSI